MADELVSFEWDGQTASIRALDVLPQELDAAMQQAAFEVGNQVAAAIRREAPRSKDTDDDIDRAHMADTIDMMTVRLNGRYEVIVFADGPHSELIPLIRSGTRPHVIRGRRGQNLAIDFGVTRGGGNGQIFYYRQVNHPGTEANDFVTRGWERQKGTLRARLARATRGALNKAGVK